MDMRGPQKSPNPKPNPDPKPKGPSGPRDSTGPKGLNGPNGLDGPKGLDASKNFDGSKGLDGPKGLDSPKGQDGSKNLDGPKGIGRPERENKKELLGTRVIEGVTAEGTRLTVTIPAGEIGNVSAIAIIDESWYSRELEVPVMTSRHDPRSGDTTYKLTNINRSEPPRSLFEVPADYRIVDKRAPKPPAIPEQPKIPTPPIKPDDKL
jgi:hypothetical protein